MKKRRLQAEIDFDFTLFGVITTLKEYKLAWVMNKQFEIELKKAEDIRLDFLKGQTLVISNFLQETVHTCVRLLKNRSIDEFETKAAFLLPELKRFDFLVMFSGWEGTYNDHQLKDLISGIPGIQFVQEFSLENIKSRENLIF